jgi:hypothetical protein
MPKDYMVGTVDDAPLLMVKLNGTQYFVDVEKGEVFEDEPGLPRVTDEEIIKTVLEQAGEVS